MRRQIETRREMTGMFADLEREAEETFGNRMLSDQRVIRQRQRASCGVKAVVKRARGKKAWQGDDVKDAVGNKEEYVQGFYQNSHHTLLPPTTQIHH